MAFSVLDQCANVVVDRKGKGTVIDFGSDGTYFSLLLQHGSRRGDSCGSGSDFFCDMDAEREIFE